jgi:LCP family protein required for cell wall assembly
MIVLSVDVASGRAAMFGVPRNMVGVPLADESKPAVPNGRYPGLLNSLYVYAVGHPKYFPGGDVRGYRAVIGAVQELVGVKIDGAVVVELVGFVKLVNAIGGVWIDIPNRVVDNSYPLETGGKKIRVVFDPGCQKLTGRWALAYARTRHQDSDYGRMRRQQAVLLAIAHQTDPLALLPKVPELLEVAGDHVWTTLKRDQIGSIAELAARVDPSEVETVTFTPPNYPSYVNTAWIKKIRRVVRNVFDGPAPKPTPSPSGTEAPIDTCRG